MMSQLETDYIWVFLLDVYLVFIVYSQFLPAQPGQADKNSLSKKADRLQFLHKGQFGERSTDK